MLLVMAGAAARGVKEHNEAGGRSSGGGGGGSGGGSSNGPVDSCLGWYAARESWVHALEAVVNGAHCTLSALVCTLVSGSRQVQGQVKPLLPTAAAVLSAAEAAASATIATTNNNATTSGGSSRGGAASCSSGPAGGVPGNATVSTPPLAASAGKLGQQQQEDQLLRLAAFALPRLLQLSAHVIGVCDKVHVALPGVASPAAGIRLTVRAAAAAVLDVCDSAHQAGDGRALGSWRQLLYDIASYGWVRDALDELRAPGRQAAGCWHRRGWEPAGPTHGTVPELTRGTLSGLTHGTAQGPTHGTPPGAPVALERAAGGAGAAGSGAGRDEGRHESSGVIGGGAELAAGEASGGREGVSAGVLPPPCEAWRVLPTCCYPLCTNLEGDSEAGVELRAWGAGTGSGAGTGAGAAGESGKGRGGGGTGGGGGRREGIMAASTDTWQSRDHGHDGAAPLYCSRHCYIAHAVFLRTREVEEEAKQQEGRG